MDQSVLERADRGVVEIGLEDHLEEPGGRRYVFRADCQQRAAEALGEMERPGDPVEGPSAKVRHRGRPAGVLGQAVSLGFIQLPLRRLEALVGGPSQAASDNF